MRDRGGGRDQRDQPVAAEEDRDARAHGAPAQGDRPARPRVAGGHDRRHPGAGQVEVEAAGEDLVDEVVDLGQVLVVDVAVLDVADHDHRRLGRVAVVAHRQRREGDVDLGVPQAEVVGDGLHRRGHVRRAGTGGEQHLADAQAQVEAEVELAGRLRGLLGRLRLHDGRRLDDRLDGGLRGRSGGCLGGLDGRRLDRGLDGRLELAAVLDGAPDVLLHGVMVASGSSG